MFGTTTPPPNFLRVKKGNTLVVKVKQRVGIMALRQMLSSPKVLLGSFLEAKGREKKGGNLRKLCFCFK